MSAKVKQVFGLGVLALGFSCPLWASDAMETGAPRTLQCHETARGYLLTAEGASCTPSRYMRSPQAAEQPVRGRDALLHYRGGETRPRMIRADIAPLLSVRTA